ncbi:MAG: SusC/RagA family protein, partial [Cytophagaceae bacterium]
MMISLPDYARNRRLKWLLAGLFLLAVQLSYAQSVITGTVTDGATGEGLAGATIQVKGTNVGATSDASGKYQISLPATGKVLVFSFIGYQPTEITVGSRSVVDAKLASSDNALSEVIVVGYGVQNRRDVTTAIGSVKARDLANQPVASFDQALAAKIAGVQVTQTSGAP